MQFTIFVLAAMAAGVLAAPPPKVSKDTAKGIQAHSLTLPQYKKDSTTPPSPNERAQAQYQKQCEGVAFPAIYPPTQAEMDCLKLQYQAQCEGVSFIAIYPPSEAQMKCMKLEYQTQCEGKSFTAIYPPSPAQQRCESLEKSLSEDGVEKSAQ